MKDSVYVYINYQSAVTYPFSGYSHTLEMLKCVMFESEHRYNIGSATMWCHPKTSNLSDRVFVKFV
jgi:hypothetical protein